MKQILFSLCLLASSCIYCEIPIKENLENYIYERIENLDSIIMQIDHSPHMNEHITIYQCGYYRGQRDTYYKIIEKLNTLAD